MNENIVAHVRVFGHNVKNTLTVVKIQTELLKKILQANTKAKVPLKKLTSHVDEVVSQVEDLVTTVKKLDSRG